MPGILVYQSNTLWFEMPSPSQYGEIIHTRRTTRIPVFRLRKKKDTDQLCSNCFVLHG